MRLANPPAAAPPDRECWRNTVRGGAYRHVVAARLHAPPRRDRAAGLVGDSVNLVRDRRDRRRVGVAYASRGCALRRGRSSRLLGHGGALRRRAPFCPAHVKGSAVPLTIELIT